MSNLQVLFFSRCSVLVWAAVSGVMSIILIELNIDLGWLYLAMGNFISSAVAPITFVLTWRDCSSTGAVAGAWIGAVCAMVAWLRVAARLGAIGVDTLGDETAMLAGNLTGLVTSPLIAAFFSRMEPQQYNWSALRTTIEGYVILDDVAAEDRTELELQTGMVCPLQDFAEPRLTTLPAAAAMSEDSMATEDKLRKGLLFSYWFGGGLSLALVVLWPVCSLAQVQLALVSMSSHHDNELEHKAAVIVLQIKPPFLHIL